MAKMLVIVETYYPDKLRDGLTTAMNGSDPPPGVTEVTTTVWTVELPRCSEFFATLLGAARAFGRACVVAQIADGTEPNMISYQNP